MMDSARSGFVVRGSASDAEAAFSRAEVADRSLVGDRDKNDVPALVRPADGLDAHPRRCPGQLAKVPLDPGDVGQLPGRPDDMTEVLRRRHDRFRFRNIRHPRIVEACLRDEFRDGLDRARLGLVGGGAVDRGRRKRREATHGQDEGVPTADGSGFHGILHTAGHARKISSGPDGRQGRTTCGGQ